MSIAMLVMISINYSRINPKFKSLKEWADYSDCVDSYMQINDYQKSQFDKVFSGSITQLVVIVLISD